MSILNIHHGCRVVNMIFVAIPDLSKAGDAFPIGDTNSLDEAKKEG